MWIRGIDLMGRTKKRHRAWKQQMKARARKRRDWGFSWGDLSPGRLVAWAEPETPKNFCSTEMENHVNEGRPLHAVKELPVTEVKQEPTPRWMDLEGQALMCLVIILLVANVINQVIKLCG